MKDKHGNELPEPMYEAQTLSEYDAPHAICHNCKSPLKGKRFTYRMFGESSSGNERVQGPLCPNCSEVPPTHLPSRRIGDSWW